MKEQPIKPTRQLLILRGDKKKFLSQLNQLQQYYVGDWLIISDDAIFSESLSPIKAKKIIGREFKHAIFDATNNFNLDAFCLLSGTLIAGSLLVVLLPLSDDFIDHDSERWNDTQAAISTPNFMAFFKQICQRYQVKDIVIPMKTSLLEFIQTSQLIITDVSLDKMQSIYLQPSQEQQNILNDLLITTLPISLLTAKRGRGKSALAGMLTHHKNCWVTAPNKSSTTTLQRFASAETTFFAPDELIKNIDEINKKRIDKPDWLIIDEAAAIPIPLLAKLIQIAPKTLLTTTTDGYEGTGQGFLLKFIKNLTAYNHFQLTQAWRWQGGDVLESITDQLLFNDTDEPDYMFSITPDKLLYSKVAQTELVNNTEQLNQLYSLLKNAHYRTTPTDLRRLLDADNLTIMSVSEIANSVTLGVLLAINEGGLIQELAYQIWQGIRRPRGNLVAQSLAAHAGVMEAAQLSSIRINRIAVANFARRQGIAKQLIQKLIEHAQIQSQDFLSVSFGYVEDVYRFWQSCGFQLVHIGSHQEMSTGHYAVMMIYPLSNEGKKLTENLVHRLARNWYWLKQIILLDIAIEVNSQQYIDMDDIDELQGFSSAHRTIEMSYASLCRLLHDNAISHQVINLQLAPLLTALIFEKRSLNQLVQLFSLSGKQAAIHLLRQETKQLLEQLK